MREYNINDIKKFEEIIIIGPSEYKTLLTELLMLNKIQNKKIYSIITNYHRKTQDVLMKDYQNLFSKGLFILNYKDYFFQNGKEFLDSVGAVNILDARELLFTKYAFITHNNLSKGNYLLTKKNIDSQNISHILSHISYHVTQNAGDTMISQALRRTFNDFSWNLIDISANVSKETIYEINMTDGAIIGGGGLLHHLKNNSTSGWHWRIPDNYLFKIKVPILVNSVGYNYFTDEKVPKHFINSLINLVKASHFFGVRSTGDANIIKSFLPHDLHKRITYQPCPTTCMEFTYNYSRKISENIIGVNIAFDKIDFRYGKDVSKILLSIAKVLKNISLKGYTIKYIAHCESDLFFIHYLDFFNTRYIVDNLTYALPNNIIECYSNIDCIIGMRLHSQLIGFGLGCRILSLITHNKLKWFLEDINSLDLGIEIRNTNDIENELMNIFYDININKPDEINKRLGHERYNLFKIISNNHNIVIQQILNVNSGKKK